ncbi:hypothetical protein GX50_05367 [[Emmonsia] crescens]|uniref:Uncharacterized protein n=1 Tax=[Emmonsia] crescens TaxID=73230 RepID=A0A2B7ZFA2_9EURO|nr:hypothetical protein GX50_05367 [Emmonsia crescens]
MLINRQNAPIVLNPTVVSNETGSVTIKADFPYDQHLLNGLTIAMLSNTSGLFEDTIDVSDHTVLN